MNYKRAAVAMVPYTASVLILQYSITDAATGDWGSYVALYGIGLIVGFIALIGLLSAVEGRSSGWAASGD